MTYCHKSAISACELGSNAAHYNLGHLFSILGINRKRDLIYYLDHELNILEYDQFTLPA